MTLTRYSVVMAPLLSAKRHHHLLKEFVMRDVRGRFAGSMAGLSWTFFNPLATIFVYFFVFSIVLRVKISAAETGTSNFAVFFLAGYSPWLLFSESLTRATGILVENTNLITKVVFPVELLPGSAVLASHLINGFMLILFMAYLALTGGLAWTWLGLVPLMLVQLVFTFGLTYFLAAFCVFVRDVREILVIVIMVWFHATPIIYPLSMVPGVARTIMLWNPMTMFVLLYRDLLLVHRVHWFIFARVTIFSAIIYLLGAWFFMRAKPAFGDVL